MSSNMTMGMINNAALLLALSIIYEISYMIKIRNKMLSRIISGVLIGLIGIAIMSMSFELAPGLVFDTRSVLISVAALTFGAVPASVAAAITIVYRIISGGIGTMTGVMVILSSLVLGLVWRRYVHTKKPLFRWLMLYIFGICVHIAMLACMFFMPFDTAVKTVGQIAVPVMAIYPVGVVLLSILLLHQSERTAALNALQESEALFRTLVENEPDMILLLKNGEISFINQAGLKLLGAGPEHVLIGRPGIDFVHPDYRTETANQWAQLHEGTRRPEPSERIYVRMDGSYVDVEVIVVPVLFNNAVSDIVFAHDISERKRLLQKEQKMEAQLRQQQKLEAIGTLAGGVAHEINNPLNGVMNYAQLILDKNGSDESLSGDSRAVSKDREAVSMYAHEIIHETERISTIVKNLLQFSRHEKQSHSYASIYDIVGQTVSLVNTIIKKDQIALDIHLDDDLPEIKCRSQQIQQVIMNLLTNARDAVNEKYPEYNENKIIRLRCHQYKSKGRKWLRLTVLDTGCGIPEEARDRIFEPFYSTKPKETGTGLGLSISYGIVSEHHGKITFETEPGEYTRFILDLPVDNGWTL